MNNITICKVKNGFIVEKNHREGDLIDMGSIMVFESLESLQRYLVECYGG